MKAIVTGTTGYVGEGVMLCCLDSPVIEEILSVSRRPLSFSHPKLKEMIVDDFMKIEAGDERLKGYDAVFFCLGMSSVGADEVTYRVTCHDIPVHFASCLSQREKMHFVYLTGGGADVKPDSRIMWARVKGQTEYDLSKMGFSGTYGFRVGIVNYPLPKGCGLVTVQ